MSRTGLILYWMLVMTVFITIACFYIPNTAFLIIVIAVFVAMCMLYGELDPLHPAVWLMFFMYLYHFSWVIRSQLELVELVQPLVTIQVSWLAIATTAWIILLFGKRKRSRFVAVSQMDRITLSSVVLPILLVFVIVLIVMANITFLQAGVTRKNELIFSGNRLLSTLAPIIRWFPLLMALWLSKAMVYRGRLPRASILAAFVLVLITGILLGERDVILQFTMSIGFLMIAFYRPPRVLISSLGFASIAFLPILSDLKNLFTRLRDGEGFLIQNQNLLLRILSNDFSAAGKNLDFIIATQGARDMFYGQTLLWDLWRSVMPGTMFRFSNAVSWFAQTYYIAHYRNGFGKGFSLTAEGFINFGYLGVILWWLGLALIVVMLYRRSNRSLLNYVFYLSSAPFFVYAMRGDFSTLLSPILKQVLLPMLVVVILSEWYWKQKSRSEWKKQTFRSPLALDTLPHESISHLDSPQET